MQTITPRLSICIATFNRAKFLKETLDALLANLSAGIEIVVLDGASTDGTPELLREYSSNHHVIRTFRVEINRGLDRQFDLCVSYARGDYCWLMSDDDLIKGQVFQELFRAMDEGHDLIVINSELRTADMKDLLKDRLLVINEDQRYDSTTFEDFFTQACQYLTFLGCIVLRRTIWMSRKRDPYLGSFFIHIGVVFQEPLESVKILAFPFIAIRYGNASWTPVSFDIWNYKWPGLVWDLPFKDSIIRKVVPHRPGATYKNLIWFRSIGAYTLTEYKKFVKDKRQPARSLIALLLACIPARLLNAVISIYLACRKTRDRASQLYDLSRATSSTSISRYLSSRYRQPVQ